LGLVYRTVVAALKSAWPTPEQAAANIVERHHACPKCQVPTNPGNPGPPIPAAEPDDIPADRPIRIG
jgi:hypothetical protein